MVAASAAVGEAPHRLVCVPGCGARERDDFDLPRTSRAVTEKPILVVECDPAEGRSLVEQLAADGYQVQLALTAAHARVLVSTSPPKLAVLGEVDSQRGAIELLEEIRASVCASSPWEPRLPTIVVGGRANEIDVLRAFDAGADDFLARPARYLELRARLRAILRRTERAESGGTLQVGSLAIDLDAHEVSVCRQRVDLRPMEFELLVHLAREPRRVCAKTELLRVVWGYRLGTTRTVDSHACRLRRKLDVAGGRPWVINVWGVGYRLI